MDRAIGNILRFGVLLAAVVVLAGGVWLLIAQGGIAHPSWPVFRGEPAELRSVTGVWTGVVAGRPLSWIQLGLLLLIATPVARVGFAVVAFAAERDRTYVAITLIVLAILLYSLAAGGL